MEMGYNEKGGLLKSITPMAMSKRWQIKWSIINEINIIQNENLFFDLDIA